MQTVATPLPVRTGAASVVSRRRSGAKAPAAGVGPRAAGSEAAEAMAAPVPTTTGAAGDAAPSSPPRRAPLERRRRLLELEE